MCTMPKIEWDTTRTVELPPGCDECDWQSFVFSKCGKYIKCCNCRKVSLY